MIAQEPVSYLERGQGEPTILFLHGLFGNPNNWLQMMEDMAGEFHTLAVQFPIDYHESRHAKDFHSIHQLTEFVIDFMDRKGLEKVVLCGNSLGGQVATDVCLQHPERCDGLVLSGSAGLFERNIFGSKFPRANRDFVMERIKEIFFDESHISESLVNETSRVLSDRPYARFLIRIAKATRKYNVKDELHKIKVPTLIVWGDSDYITPPEVAIEFKENIERAELVFLEKCGHAPPIEQPEEFTLVLRDFMNRNYVNAVS